MHALATLPQRHPYIVIASAYLLFLIPYVIVRPSIHSCITGGPNLYSCSPVFSGLDMLFFFTPLSFVLLFGIFGFSLLRWIRSVRLKEHWHLQADVYLVGLSLLAAFFLFEAAAIWTAGPALGLSN